MILNMGEQPSLCQNPIIQAVRNYIVKDFCCRMGIKMAWYTAVVSVKLALSFTMVSQAQKLNESLRRRQNK